MSSPRLPVCFVVSEDYFAIALAQGCEILRNEPLVEVHVFLESETFLGDIGFSFPNLFVHRNELLNLVPGNLLANEKWPLVVYARIFLPYVLPHSKILYLDADVARVGTLEPLVQLDISGVSLAAVHDAVLLRENPRLKFPKKALLRKNSKVKLPKKIWLKSIGINCDEYFNAGVILMNAERWRQFDIQAEIKFFFERYTDRILHCDQDFLNYFFQGDWLPISPKWNYQLSLLGYGIEQSFQPALVHFTDSIKPWHWDIFHYSAEAKSYYRRILQGISIPFRVKQPQHRIVDRLSNLKQKIRLWAYRRGMLYWKTKQQLRAFTLMRDEYVEFYSEKLPLEPREKAILLQTNKPDYDGRKFRCTWDIKFPS